MKVVLRQDRSPRGSSSLWATVKGIGDLVIEGQDLGAMVEEFWGAGNTEYEWAITVPAAHVPRVVTALGGADHDDVLSILATRCAEDVSNASTAFLQQHNIPFDLWNRVGN